VLADHRDVRGLASLAKRNVGTPTGNFYAWRHRNDAPCESWFGKLKTEWVYPHGVYATRNEAELAIVEYIEMIYNGDRVHQALDYQTPNECETKYFDEQFALTAMSK